MNERNWNKWKLHWLPVCQLILQTLMEFWPTWNDRSITVLLHVIVHSQHQPHTVSYTNPTHFFQNSFIYEISFLFIFCTYSINITGSTWKCEMLVHKNVKMSKSFFTLVLELGRQSLPSDVTFSAIVTHTYTHLWDTLATTLQVHTFSFALFPGSVELLTEIHLFVAAGTQVGLSGKGSDAASCAGTHTHTHTQKGKHLINNHKSFQLHVKSNKLIIHRYTNCTEPGTKQPVYASEGNY